MKELKRPTFDDTSLCSYYGTSSAIFFKVYLVKLFSKLLQIIDILNLDLLLENLKISRQKQPPRGVPRKRCSENMQQIYRRKPMPKCDFNKDAKQL